MPGEHRVRLGLLKDQGFNFYYQDALDLLTAFGAELVPCSPLSGRGLPADLHGLYIGGGFPEMFLEDLSRNTLFQTDLKAAADSGMPIYAECGGLMYLTASIIDFDNREYPAAGLIDGCCRMGKKRAGLGYVTAEALQDNLICGCGTSLRGHEFHYSTLELGREYPRAYRLSKWGDNNTWQDGVLTANILASYVHLHFAGCPGAARRFIDNCERYKNSW
jgi:cobyrinic acid a,c-diamide synthase